jgi:hypothetical protein
MTLTIKSSLEISITSYSLGSLAVTVMFGLTPIISSSVLLIEFSTAVKLNELIVVCVLVVVVISFAP